MSSKVLALEEQLNSATTIAQRIDRLNQLAWELRDLKQERALALAEEAYRLAASTQGDGPTDPVAMAHSLIVLAFLDWRVSRLEPAITRALEAAHLLEKAQQPAWLPRAYNIIACNHDELGNRSEAFAYLVKQLELSQTLQDHDQEATAYHDLGYFYKDGGEYQKAIAYFEIALTVFRALDDTVGVVLACSNQHNAYLALGLYDQAFVCASDALATARAVDYQYGQLLGWLGQGSVYQAWRQFDQALLCYNAALQIAQQSKDPLDKARTFTQLGELYTRIGDYAAALAALSEGLAISQQVGSPHWQGVAHQALVALYKAQGDYQRALVHCEHYYQIKETVFSQSNERRVKALEVIHRTEATRREAELLREKNRQLEREILERERAEQALIQTQKLESLGILAGGVAHDFNNLLTAMIGQSSLALHELPAGHSGRRYIDKSLQSMQRAAKLAQQMLAYSGKGHFQVATCDLNRVIQADLPLLKSIVAQAGLELAPADQPLLIEADTGQLYQIVMNLALNAAEAGATKITVQTHCQTITAADTAFWQYTGQPLAPGDYAVLTVTDNGVGMSALTLTRLFDPFYTTKFVGRGLGLAAVLGIIRGHRGGIAVQSQPGQGATFTVSFPLTARTLNLQPEPLSVPVTLNLAGLRTILIIEDEQDLRESLVDFFSLTGINTLTAADGFVGLTQFRQKQAQIDLVLLDLTMPGINGIETLAQLRQIDRTIPVIFSSGYTQQSVEAQLAQDQRLRFLAKPYSLEELTRTVLALQQAL